MTNPAQASAAPAPPVAARLAKVGADSFERIHRELLHPMDPRIAAARWRFLFEPAWDYGEDHVGYALQAGERTVGFAAYIFGRQVIGGTERKVCNFSSWVVDPAYRPQAMGLVMPLLRRKDVLVTNLTSLPSVREIFLRLGFRELESHVRVHWPGSPLERRDTEMHFDRDIPVDRLLEVDRPVHRAHLAVARSMRVETRHGACYVVYTISRRKKMKSARLHHISPADGLSHALPAIKAGLMRRHAVLLVEHDRRLAAGTPGNFTDVVLPVARLYRGEDAAPHEISNAFSETVLLNC